MTDRPPVPIEYFVGRMIEVLTRAGEHMGEIFVHPDLESRLDRVPANLGDHGVDPFGYEPEYVKKVIGLAAWFYRYYFRCAAEGVGNIPSGRCIVVANHSGQLPFDGAMISLASFLDRDPPRVLRAMVERFVPSTPFVSTFLRRCGQVLGTPDNCRRLLAAEEGILVFPEGTRGLNKVWKKRYQLQRFGSGFMRIALETKTPVIPCAVIGAEEQAPTLWNLSKLGRQLGVPAFPISLPLIPLPTRYRIYFGEPMIFEGDGNEVGEEIQEHTSRVKDAVDAMIAKGLAQREHVFW